jgi:hypothetical protein
MFAWKPAQLMWNMSICNGFWRRVNAWSECQEVSVAFVLQSALVCFCVHGKTWSVWGVQKLNLSSLLSHVCMCSACVVTRKPKYVELQARETRFMKSDRISLQLTIHLVWFRLLNFPCCAIFHFASKDGTKQYTHTKTLGAFIGLYC